MIQVVDIYNNAMNANNNNNIRSRIPTCARYRLDPQSRFHSNERGREGEREKDREAKTAAR